MIAGIAAIDSVTKMAISQDSNIIADRSSTMAMAHKPKLSVQQPTYPAAKPSGTTIISDPASIGSSTDLVRDVEQPRSDMVEDASPARVP